MRRKVALTSRGPYDRRREPDTHVGPPAHPRWPRGIAQQIGVYVFVVVPLLALIVAVPFAWGWGLGWADVAIAAVFYVVSGLGITVGFHRYFTHGSFKAARPLRIALAVAGQPGDAGTGHRLGGRPPAPPRVLRQGGRPALAVAVRHRPGRAGQGVLAFAHRLAVQPRPDQREALHPRPARRSRRHAREPVVRPVVGGHAAGARPARRPADLVLVGRAHRVLLGGPRARCAAAPRDVVDQLDLPHDRRRAVRRARPLAQRLAAGGPVVRRVMAQPAPRRPHVRPPRRAARSGRHLRPGDPGLREARLGHLGALAHAAAAGAPHRQARHGVVRG